MKSGDVALVVLALFIPLLIASTAYAIVDDGRVMPRSLQIVLLMGIGIAIISVGALERNQDVRTIALGVGGSILGGSVVLAVSERR